MLMLVVFLASCDGVILPLSEEKLANNGGSEISGLEGSDYFLWLSQFYPNAGIETEDISNLKPQDQGSEPDPDSTEIGDTFLGPSGTEYILKPENLSDQEIEDLANLGYVGSGVWIPISR